MPGWLVGLGNRSAFGVRRLSKDIFNLWATWCLHRSCSRDAARNRSRHRFQSTHRIPPRLARPFPAFPALSAFSAFSPVAAASLSDIVFLLGQGVSSRS